MTTAISASTSIPYSVTSGAELATLQKELVSYQKQLTAVQTGVTESGPVETQLLATQVSLLTAQIVSLSGTPTSSAQPLASSPQAATGLPAASTSGVTPVATLTEGAVLQVVQAPAPAPVNDQAALSQAQATLSAIFEKASVQGASPPVGSGQAGAASAQTSNQNDTASVASDAATGSVQVGSTINVTV